VPNTDSIAKEPHKKHRKQLSVDPLSDYITHECVYLCGWVHVNIHMILHCSDTVNLLIVSSVVCVCVMVLVCVCVCVCVCVRE